MGITILSLLHCDYLCAKERTQKEYERLRRDPHRSAGFNRPATERVQILLQRYYGTYLSALCLTLSYLRKERTFRTSFPYVSRHNFYEHVTQPSWPHWTVFLSQFCPFPIVSLFYDHFQLKLHAKLL